jgi:hypothetical protein
MCDDWWDTIERIISAMKLRSRIIGSGIATMGVVWKDDYEGLMCIRWLMSTLETSK